MRLDELADVGPFFALRTGEGGLPLLGEETVRQRVATVAARLGTDDTRVAASIAFQGIAGRLLSIGLGSAVLTGEVPDLAAGGLRWEPTSAAPDDLWLPSPAALPGEDLRTAVVQDLLVPLHDLIRTVTPISSPLLWGNAGSSLAGSLRVLHTWCLGRNRTEDAARAVALTHELFTDPLLRDTGVLSDTTYIRRTCCLYYRVPGGGMCGDCVLRHPPRHSARRR
ncbi:(2Fe-2S)-binding protein [Streptomyces sp. UNOB3_S3]|uniref:(2Fe-2S)-binding protein n=1 Tax=Streptomyces sp. UNOB3_S3 TaxID=2871682 RepID=UPI001E4D83EB|nr:(2Fe-2S)-binding protein [Streptomyces sp. UNOB3_S3]MCC3777724.1 (2Fe-2S)-binding protein [Streptomyces sp. UNOB3_S3]